MPSHDDPLMRQFEHHIHGVAQEPMANARCTRDHYASSTTVGWGSEQ